MRANKTLELLNQLKERILDDHNAFCMIYDIRKDIEECVEAEIKLAELSAEQFEQVYCRFSEIMMTFEKATDCSEVMESIEKLYSLVEESLEKESYFIELDMDTLKGYRMKDISYHHMDSRYLFMEDEFEKFWNKIEQGENFSLLCWGDGERAVLTQAGVKAQEGWAVPESEEVFSNALLVALQLEGENVYHGISCPCCDAKAYYWYRTHMNSKQLTFANLWVNCNYQNFIKRFVGLKRDVVVIANEIGKNSIFGELNVLDYYCITNDCLDFFRHHLNSLIEEIKEKYGTRKNLLFAISAGPLAEMIISALYRNNPENTYIDFGSSLDILIHHQITRPYMIESYPECFMHDPAVVSADVTVVMNLYKRPEYLLQQLEALENQTLPPKEILLFQDRLNGYYQIELAEEIKRRFTNVHICEENTGVWGRFAYAQKMASCPYVCIFDDDTIPGDRWLENCHIHMNQEEAVYAAIGIILNKSHHYPHGGAIRVGWAAPRQRPTEVDFAGHAWFVKREYLTYLFENTQSFSEKYKYVAEDIMLSVQCQKHGIRTVIPTHYIGRQQFWGSQPELARVYGGVADGKAVSSQEENYIKMNMAVCETQVNGWKPLVYHAENYVHEIVSDVIDMERNRIAWEDEL